MTLDTAHTSCYSYPSSYSSVQSQHAWQCNQQGHAYRHFVQCGVRNCAHVIFYDDGPADHAQCAGCVARKSESLVDSCARVRHDTPF